MLSNSPLKEELKSGLVLEDDHPCRIKFYIEDTGIGIKEEECEKLFKLFKRSGRQDNKNTNGIGLGLTISNKLAMSLDTIEKSEIDVQSRFGEGSVFSFIGAGPER